MRAGNLLGVRPARAHPPAPDAHPGVHGPPDAPAGAADRRDRRRPPRRDGRRPGRPADLVADFALPIPSLVICELLGRALRRPRVVPGAHQPPARHLAADGRAARAGPGEPRVHGRPRRAGAGGAGRRHARHARARPRGDDLSTDELIGIAELLLIAGHETTSNMLGLGTLALLRHPEQLALVRDDPAAVAPRRRGAAALPRHRALGHPAHHDRGRGGRRRRRSRPTRW